jgi:hypothetical protein
MMILIISGTTARLGDFEQNCGKENVFQDARGVAGCFHLDKI